MFENLSMEELESAVDYIHEQISTGVLTHVEIAEVNVRLRELLAEINRRLAREYPDE